MSSPSDEHENLYIAPQGNPFAPPEAISLPNGPEPAHDPQLGPSRPPRRVLPLVLLLATCTTTYMAGGPIYAAALLTTLLAHEFGHYLQAKRYQVPASLPFFIPMSPPLGTMGAVIAMRGHMGNRKALFDIGISGPLAGLVPALAFSVIGLQQSKVVDLAAGAGRMTLGEPLLFQFLARWTFGPLPASATVDLGPMAFAGWVGIFITALNLIPIGQLDGGHILYALLLRKSYPVTTGLLVSAIAAALYTQSYQWSLMLMLLIVMGPNHPPTADDQIPLGLGRTILGWVTLAFILIGFTPTPFSG